MSKGSLLIFTFWLAATAGAQETARVSVEPRGSGGDALSRRAVVAGDRWAAFVSDATSLVRDDENASRDVFLRDSLTLRTIRISVSSEGAEGDGNSFDPSLSADARWIAFESLATNLVPEDTNNKRDVFVRDLQTKTTERVSVSGEGGEATGASFQPSISLDGSRVAFRSDAPDLVGDDTNDVIDIFVRDRLATATVRASVATDGSEANDISNRPALSGDGAIVAFESAATNLVVGDDNGVVDVFVRDLVAGTTQRVSLASDGTQGDGDSRSPSITDDGRYVVFESAATNLVADDDNDAWDVFLHDRVTGATTRISAALGGGDPDGPSFEADISGDRAVIAFASDATNLVADDDNGVRDVYVTEASSGATERVSRSTDGTQADAACDRPCLSSDGRVVGFDADATNLVPGDANGVGDVFVRWRDATAGLACRAGNVNAAAGPITDVLMVNRGPGSGPGRNVVLEPTDLIEIMMSPPPSRPGGPSRFVLYAWVGHPTPITAVDLPYALGSICLPNPLITNAAPMPKEIWNNIGKPQFLGEPTRPSTPAPSVVLRKPSGLGIEISFFIQGVIIDTASSQGQAAVTNGIAVTVRP